jgi:RNA polymerase sigma-70 factor (ECF subfamily)
MQSPEPTEHQLIQGLIARGPAAQAAMQLIFNAYRPRLLAWCRSFGLEAADAEDVTQEAFQRLYVNAATFRGDAKISTWLYKVARNLTMDHMRRHRPEVNLDEDVWERELSQLPAPDTHFACGLAPEEALQQCYDAGFAKFAQDFPQCATVVRLAAHEGWGTAEIAEHLGRQLGATRQYLSQCKKKLRPYLEMCRQYLKELA